MGSSAGPGAALLAPSRFIMVPSLHPDWTLLLFFAHTHSTITMTLALVFIPKVTLGPGMRGRRGWGSPAFQGPLDELTPHHPPVPARRLAAAGGDRGRGLRGRAGHAALGLLLEQQHRVRLERAQS